MNWQAISFDWNHVRAFLATAEEGSLSAAARVLGQTQPTIGRQVSALEEKLGVVLFERVGLGLQLTPSGQEILQHVFSMGEAAARISMTASGRSQTIEGNVSITASDIMAVHVLPPILKRLRDAAPRLTIDVIAANDIQDILKREADIAIRHVRPERPELIATLVQEASAHLYAAKTYLEKYGHPKNIEDLSSHQFIGFGDPDRMITFLAPLGIKLTRENFRIESKNGVFAWELVRQGLGIAVMSEEVGSVTAEVERLVPSMEPMIFPVWLVTHRELHTSKRIRLVFDMLADFFKSKT